MLFLNTPKWRSFGESVRNSRTIEEEVRESATIKLAMIIVITTIMAIVLGEGVRKGDNEDFVVI